MKRRASSQAFGGLVLIGVGALFLARQLGYIDFSIGELFANFWPAILILWGVQQILGVLEGRQGAGSMFSALICTGLGVFFLGNNLEWFALTFGDLVKMLLPAALIIGGLSVILRPRRNDPPAPPVPPVPPAPPQGPSFYEPASGSSAGPEVPPAAPLASTLDEEFERKFGKLGGPGADSSDGQGTTPGAEKAADPGAAGNFGPSLASAPRRRETDDNEDRDEEDFYGDHGSRDRHQRRREERHERHMERRREQAERHRRTWEERGRHGGGHSSHDNEHSTNRSTFIGDVHLGREYFQLKHTNISQFIGDTVLDLTNAQIPYGETKINISAFIGDLKIYIPDDMDLGISVNSSSFIGDMEVLEQARSGFMSSVQFKTPYYKEAGRRLKINISAFIGDIKVKTVG
ncbi:cell wall-active antibiotics response protein LiaF [Paenibacillus spiritus]|nr:cell wall-active antibiotics response protein LiaF [Paenibacillus spiritus]